MEKIADKPSRSYRAAYWSGEVLSAWPWLHISVTGTHNLPLEGPAILAFTHHNSQDTVALGHIVYEQTGRPVHFMAKEELLANRIAGPILSSMHGLPVNRERITQTQMKDALRILKNGFILGQAAERRRIDGEKVLVDPKRGPGILAVRTNVKLIPAAVSGQNWRRKRGKKSGSPRVFLPRTMHVHIPEPIETTGLGPNDGEQVNEQLQIVLQQALETAYSEYEVLYGERAASRLDRSPVEQSE